MLPDGQVLGGGVIVAVAVLLWLIYLLPSWYQRHQFEAAELNAVRLNRALRVLAETSETPEEVHVELTARAAAHQQRLARRAMAERELAEIEEARLQLEAARALPAARRARARRRSRIMLTLIALAAVGLAGWGAWQVVTTGSQLLLWWSVGVAIVCALLLRRMSLVSARIARRAVAETAATVAPARAATAPVDADLTEDRTWQPRELPRPLTASAGSRAAATVDAVTARDQLRQAALREAHRAASAPATAPRPAMSHVARAGVPDDAEIEAHVRELLRRRAAS